MTRTTSPQKGYIMRGHASDSRAELAQDRAAFAADCAGDTYEAAQRRLKAEEIRRRSKQREAARVYVDDAFPGIVMALGATLHKSNKDPDGVDVRGDSIAVMLWNREISLAQGKVCLLLRQHEAGINIFFEAQSFASDYVDGGSISSMDTQYDPRNFGRKLREAGDAALDPAYSKLVIAVVLGFQSIRQARNKMGFDTSKGTRILKAEICKMLSASGAVIGSMATRC